MPIRLGSLLLDKIYLGDIKIAKAYLGNKLVFDGEQWIWCLAAYDSEKEVWLWLETEDGEKLQPKLEVN